MHNIVVLIRILVLSAPVADVVRLNTGRSWYIAVESTDVASCVVITVLEEKQSMACRDRGQWLVKWLINGLDVYVNSDLTDYERRYSCVKVK